MSAFLSNRMQATRIAGVLSDWKSPKGGIPQGTKLGVILFSVMTKARFKRKILHAPNAIQTMHNEEAYLIIYCLNCIRCMQNSTFETGLMNSP